MPRPSNLSLDILETFVTLVRHGGEAAVAAQELDINQPSMSKRLAVLQHARRGVTQPWIVRQGKRWALTDEGRRALPAVEEIVRRYRTLLDSLDLGETHPADVRFGCGRHAAVGFVHDAVARLRVARPKLRVRVSTLRGRERIDRVANGSLDLATVTHDEQQVLAIARRPLHVEHLFSDRLVLAVGRAAPRDLRARFAALPDTVTASHLADLPLILPEPDSGIRAQLDRALRDAGVYESLDILLEIGGWETILKYVSSGVGIGVSSESAAQAVSGLTLRPVSPRLIKPTHVRLISRLPTDDRELSEAAALFRAQLRAIVSERKS
jgi:DNA-binding transcriptional LysR family regulator